MLYLVFFVAGIFSAYAFAYAREEYKAQQIIRRARQEQRTISKLKSEGWHISRDVFGWDVIDS